MMHMQPSRQTSGPLIALALVSVTLAGATPASAQNLDADITHMVRAKAGMKADAKAAADADMEQRRERDLRIERTDRSTETLTLGPSGSLELRNVSGNIMVHAGTGRDVVIEITRRSRGRTEADAAQGLQDVEPTIDHRGERATVEMSYRRNDAPYQVSATFDVTAPAGTRITARSVSGNVEVTGIKGDVAAEVVSGNVEITASGRVSKASSISGNVTLSDIQGSETLSVTAISGNVEMTNVQARRVSVDITSGNVRADEIRCDSASLKSLSGSVEFSGRVAPNGRYELNSHSGSVRFEAAGPVGFELQATSFSGRIDTGQLSLNSASRNRGALRATVGNGSAVVVVQTFSGNVEIERR